MCLADGAECPAQLDAGAVGDGGIPDAGVADGGPHHLFVKKAGAPPSIDGKVDDAVWTTLPTAVTRLNSGSNNNTSTFGVLWDDSYLYVAVKVLDSDLRNDSTGAWDDDSVEIYIDGAGERSPGYDGNDRQFIKGWNDSAITAPQNGVGVLHGTADIAGGYTLELAIPWSNMGVTPSVNMTLGFDVQQNDDDTGGARQGAKSWNAINDTNFMSTAGFGLLTLSPPSPTQSGDAGSPNGPEWIPLPRRTEAQRAAGLLGGEGGQLIWDITFAPSNGHVAYLVRDTDGAVWRSSDDGVTWVRKGNGMQAYGGTSLVVSPADENLVLVAGSRQSPFIPIRTSPTDGIYRTSNGGESWELVHRTHFLRQLQNGGDSFAFLANGILYAGTHDQGLLRSTDAGRTWTALNLLMAAPITELKAHPTQSKLYAVIDGQGLYEWSESSPGVAAKIGRGLPAAPNALVLDPQSASVLYAAVPRSGAPGVDALGGVYLSTDSGRSFTRRSNGLDTLYQRSPIANANYMAISPTDPNRLFVSFRTSGLSHPYFTSDRGLSWHEPTNMNADGLGFGGPQGGSYWTAPIATHPTNPLRAVTCGGGSSAPVVTTDGGSTWRYSGNGLTGSVMGGRSSMSFDPHDPNRFVLFFTDSGAFLTENGGASFRDLNVPKYRGEKTTNAGALDPTPGSQVIITATGGWWQQSIAVSSDNGSHWKVFDQKSSGVTGWDGGTEDDYKYIAFHPQKLNIVYAGSFRSTDKGSSWSPLSKKVEAVFAGNGDVVYSLPSSGAQVVSKSTDGGNTWSQPYPPVPWGTSENFVVDPVDQNRFYAATTGGLFIYNGSSWLRPAAAQGLVADRYGKMEIRAIAVDPRDPRRLYVSKLASGVGPSNGIFRSIDGGKSWQNINFNLGAEFLAVSLHVSPHTGDLYLGSYSGTWRLPNPVSVP